MAKVRAFSITLFAATSLLFGQTPLGSGLPYNVTTGTTDSGDTGATTDRPVINGVVVGRNAGHGNPIYDVSPALERAFGTERLQVVLRAESFNVFNHANFVGYSGTYGNGAAAGAGFGVPLVGITAQFPARSVQFSVKVRLYGSSSPQVSIYGAGTLGSLARR